MNTAISLDGVQAIFSYAFKDPRWKMKFLIGTLLGFAGFIIPILPGIFLLGYCATIMRQIIVEHADPSLPEWADFGALFSRGLKMLGNSIIFSLPVAILAVGGYALMMIPIFADAITQRSSNNFYAPMGGLQMFSMLAGMGVFSLGMLLTLPILFFMIPAITHGVAKDSFSAAFHVREWWKILRANVGGFMTALVVIWGAYFLLVFGLQILYMTIILCILIPFVMSILMFYMSLVTAAAVAEAYRRGVEKLGPAAAPSEVTPLPELAPTSE